MEFLKQLRNIGREIGKQAKIRAKKPFNQYRALERAQKEIDDQKVFLKRAPLNVPKREFTKEQIEHSKSFVEESMKSDDEFLSKLSKIKVTSDDPDGPAKLSNAEHSHQRPTQLTNKLPIKQSAQSQTHSAEIPRGIVPLPTLIDILHNHHLEPNEWTAEVLSEKFKLRQSDVDDFLKNTSLIDETDKSKVVLNEAI
uniref:NADH dehydrogenase [ubiquinone] 1 alpha subcomplex assembly factor 4 n=1 Tax=Ciona savignyi TaxID=51511 RepID=H2YKA7_CIOSA